LPLFHSLTQMRPRLSLHTRRAPWLRVGGSTMADSPVARSMRAMNEPASEWNSGNVSVHDPAAATPAQSWRTWRLPGRRPRTYAVYVDERDLVWLSDFGANAVLRFDPESARFDSFVFPREAANVRQILGRPGEVWLPESGTEHISVIRTAA
jgi:streptogramin lyase